MTTTKTIIGKRERKDEAAAILKTLEAAQDDIANGPSEALVHFNIVLGAITQVANGDIQAIHPSVNASLVAIPKILSREHDKLYSEDGFTDDELLRLCRIEKLEATLPALSSIARTLIDYSSEQERSAKKSAAQQH